MPDPESSNVIVESPLVRPMQRARWRTGFALCAASLGATMLAIVAQFSIAALAGAPGHESVRESLPRVDRVALGVGFALEALLVAGLVNLYTAPIGDRWRRTGMIVLGACGADLALVALELLGTNAEARDAAAFLSGLLTWVELWMLAVLAADAALALERLDLVYQTEVVGRLIVWGGFVWLASCVWTVGPKPAPVEAAAPMALDLNMILRTASYALLLFVLVRSMWFCASLAVECGTQRGATSPPDATQLPPGGPN